MDVAARTGEPSIPPDCGPGFKALISPRAKGVFPGTRREAPR
jgi:hypothetical protein